MKINTQELETAASKLRTGDKILLSGYIYTARDAAHKRFAQIIKEGKKLPFPLNNSTIYYAGPTGTKEGMAIGSCGPTTSGRMDPYTPMLLDLGLKGIIGKGERNEEVEKAIRRNKAAYFCAIGGAGALAGDRAGREADSAHLSSGENRGGLWDDGQDMARGGLPF